MFGRGSTSQTAVLEQPAEREPVVSEQAAFGNVGPEETEVSRILIADESASLRRILRHMVSALGWQILEAQDGEQVLELARSTPAPHAILLDLGIPKISGYEVCQRLKADERCQLIPIVAITPEDSTELKLKALEAGADDFLVKPISRAELTARLRCLMRIQRFNQELIGAESVAMALARAVAAKDGYAHRHVEEVAHWAVELGNALGLDVAEIKLLRYGAILHNVGKIGIPDAVLEKTGALTPREMALFQQHPRVGCDICAPLKPLKPVLPIIRHHKERWDGTGYPDGLRGSEIPLGAQIVGVVNVYIALTSNRPYRKAISREQSVAQLREQARSGAHNPELVERFVQCLLKAGATTAPAVEGDAETRSE